MKKAIKISALCLALIMLTAMFSGCSYLDKLKANQAIIGSDSQTITFNGNTYKRLPKDITPYMVTDYSAESNYSGDVYVNDENVPVLLSGSFYYSSDYDKKTDIFRVYISNNGTDDWYYFCNEKSYNDYINTWKSNSLNRIGIEYEKSLYSDDYFDYTLVLDICDEDLSNEIFDYIKNPQKMTDKTFQIISEDNSIYSLQRWMYKCDEKGLVAESLVDSYDIVKTSSGEAYIANYLTETAAKLSSENAAKLKDEYFFGTYFENYDSADEDTMLIF